MHISKLCGRYAVVGTRVRVRRTGRIAIEVPAALLGEDDLIDEPGPQQARNLGSGSQAVCRVNQEFSCPLVLASVVKHSGHSEPCSHPIGARAPRVILRGHRQLEARRHPRRC